MNPAATISDQLAPAARVNILGIGISVLDMHEAVRETERFLGSGQQGFICAVDAHSIVESLRDQKHKQSLNRANLTVADGMPLVWIGRLRGNDTMGRVYGPDFLIEVCRVSEQRGWRHFFYGGAPGVAEKVSERLRARFPELRIAGTSTPPYRPLTVAEEYELAARIEQANVDILWIGLGAPKQERFMADHCGKLHCRLMVGVGAAFDFHAGVVKEAPRWLHRTGLQWAYRLIREPRRLGRRYLACIPSFMWNVSLELTGVRKFRLET
ncbi:MAG TPA: WecB/TagA/CpsF family glycosyltransferase [Terracidiphilus sp.]|jgi:N-acetylglucosaminyldiphosphoundecaprenol N-acetyl-beta-D-mannosaminyltransferase|nr:WecB/TagA/CpsF family glycosyltransferase [Terracidiphilus sp.]